MFFTYIFAVHVPNQQVMLLFLPTSVTDRPNLNGKGLGATSHEVINVTVQCLPGVGNEGLIYHVSTPQKTNECPLKRDDISIGNTSEPTIIFQGICEFSGEYRVFLSHVLFLFTEFMNIILKYLSSSKILVLFLSTGWI